MEVAPDVSIDEEALRSFGRQHHVRWLRLFGSALRGELRPDSDIDLLVEFEPGHVPGLLAMAQMELDLGALMGREVELRTPRDLSRYFREAVVAEARVLYDAA